MVHIDYVANTAIILKIRVRQTVRLGESRNDGFSMVGQLERLFYKNNAFNFN